MKRFDLIQRISLLCLTISMLNILACGSGSVPSVIEASGEIEAKDIAVSSQVPGKIADIPSEEGQDVTANDTLVLVDREAIDISIRQANGVVDAAAAQLDLLLTGARSEDIARARETVNSAKAALGVAEADFNRAKSLYEEKTITEKRRDDLQAAYAIAKAQYNSALQALATVSNIARPQEIELAQAHLDQAIAARDMVLKTSKDCTITAPSNGVITHIPVEIGELVNPGSVVVVISTLDTVDLMIYVTEVELGFMQLGQSATVKIDSYPDREFEGKVTFISPEAEFTPKNVQTKEDRVKLVFGVKIRIPNPDHLLKPGLPADASLKVAESS